MYLFIITHLVLYIPLAFLVLPEVGNYQISKFWGEFAMNLKKNHTNHMSIAQGGGGGGYSKN